jgi:hypothetical protein
MAVVVTEAVEDTAAVVVTEAAGVEEADIEVAMAAVMVEAGMVATVEAFTVVTVVWATV